MPKARDLPSTWFAQRGWTPFPFQRDTWRHIAAGRSGLLHASTGAGKTYAVWLGLLARLTRTLPARGVAPLQVLWITPMRALAADTQRSLHVPLDELQIPWTLGLRTGDTPSAERARQTRRMPSALITTPESLTLLLTRAAAEQEMGQLQAVVVDEWHELVGNKRGVQLQLALARLRRWHPQLMVWGISATLGNLEHAQHVLLPQGGGERVQGQEPKRLEVDCLLPDDVQRFPWAGHMGLAMLPAVVRELDASASSLVFTNTRAQAESWYQALLSARPDWAGVIALHHGSLARPVREWVEQGLKAGQLKAVVCTSSLDLGVDFLPVERVLQVGSAKGVARLMQRAGRSGHAPGRLSRVSLVPTHSLELVEAAAAADAVAQRKIEPRLSPERPLDVLVQHLVSMALAAGFTPDELLAEVRSTWAYRDLTDAQWAWALAFVRHGGPSLTAYPDYRRVEPDASGRWVVPDARLARRHRMGIGTIVSDASIHLRYWSKNGGGHPLGSVEEAFIARLRPGDAFLFAGRTLELVTVEGMTAFVRRSQQKRPAIPRWNGGRMPLSNELAEALLARFDQATAGRYQGGAMEKVKPLLELQKRWSDLPGSEVLLLEAIKTREGFHLFIYPFAGRLVHSGLASLLAYRLAQRAPTSFSLAVNDYGLELLSPTPVDWQAALDEDLLGAQGLMTDVLASLNAGELAMRRFREIAQISGLIFGGYPGAQKSTRQVQASSGLFFEVFNQYDGDNLLLAQAREEVLRQELDLDRLSATLARIGHQRLDLRHPPKVTPLAFPLLVERMRESLSSEKLADRIARMVRDLEHAAEREMAR